ncbi:MAG: hypothetical protein RIS84_117 [Pseudomonadota bacterium]|jgi:hypothetical protein
MLKNMFNFGQVWVRGITMLMFILFFYYVGIYLVLAVVVIQFGSVLGTGKLNEQLLQFGRSLSIYVYDVMSYLTYNTDEKPFPFSDWPRD